jgi:hypothetical protein
MSDPDTGNNRGGRGYNRGRFNGRFNRSQGRSNGSNNSSQKEKEKEYKFHIHRPGVVTNMTFTNVLKHIANKIQKTEKYSNDIVTSIRAMELIDLNKKLPIREKSKEDDDELRDAEQETFDKIYEEEIKTHVLRKARLQNLLPKVYSIIWQDHCTETLQHEIEQLPNFLTEIEDNPINLLKAIREHMHTTTRATYPMMGYVQAYQNLFNCKQQENESLINFAKRMKNAGDVLKSIVGNNTMDYFMKIQGS